MNTGIIIRINGPIVEARGMEQTGMLEVVEVGEVRLVGEVIRLRGGNATIQVYENTGGLRPGEPVFCTGRQLSVCLGPGLLGTIYDGIQRPLNRIAEQSGSAFLARGEKTPAVDMARKWHFAPKVAVGTQLSAGQVVGEVQETESVLHKVMVPPGSASFPKATTTAMPTCASWRGLTARSRRWASTSGGRCGMGGRAQSACRWRRLW